MYLKYKINYFLTKMYNQNFGPLYTQLQKILTKIGSYVVVHKIDRKFNQMEIDKYFDRIA